MSKYSVGAKRGQVAYDNKDGGGIRLSGAINPGTCQMKFWKPSLDNSGYNSFDIVPWKIAGKLTAEQVTAGMKPGDLEFILNYAVHRNCGPNKETLLCTKRTYGKGTCDACEEAHKAYEAGNKDLGGSLKSSVRSIMVVRPHGPNGPLPLHLFDVSQYLFTTELLEKASAMTRGKGLVPFYEPGLDGKLVEVRAVKSEKKDKRHQATEFKDFMFYDRQIPVTDEEIESIPCLNSMLVQLSAADFNAIFYGAGDPEPGNGGAQADTHGGQAEQQAQSTGGYRPPQAQQPAYSPASQAPAQQQAQADSPAQQAPQAEQQTGNYAPNRTAPATQASQPAPAPEATSCPYGGNFGKDCDKLDACSRCDSKTWRACDKASKAS